MLPRYDEIPGGTAYIRPVTWYQVAGHPVYELTSIRVLPYYRGQGVGSRLLARICAEADRQEAIIFLTVSATLAEPGLSDEQLWVWYMRYGFYKRASVSDWYMQRMPIINGQPFRIEDAFPSYRDPFTNKRV
jgi:ribosomal protein S18 acetylase RimI-like enzyme